MPPDVPIGQRFARRFDRITSSIFDRRHPGVFAQYLLTAIEPLVVRTAVNDKWNLRWFIPRWMLAIRVAQIPPLPAPRDLFIFCAYRIEFTLNLVLAVLLAWRGHRVTLGYLPKLQSPNKAPFVSDHPSAKGWLRFALSNVEQLSRGRIRAVDLTDAAVQHHTVDESFVQQQAFADTVMGTMRETFDLADETTRRTYEYMCEVGRSAQRHARAHFGDHRYDVCIIPNGTGFEAAHFFRIAREFGLPTNTLEKFSFRNVRSINHDGDFMSFKDLELVWEARDRLGFMAPDALDRACRLAMTLLQKRRRNETDLWAWALQTAPPQTPDEAVASIGVPRGSRFALVCTNVPYDVGYNRLRNLFPSMRAWLVETVRFLLDASDGLVVVRAHPGEAAPYGGKERSERNLAEAGITSSRLIVLPGEAPVNTYGLIERAAFGVVFSTTVGMEMAMLGKQVLVGSDVYYNGRGFTRAARSRSDYFKNLADLSSGGEQELPEHLQKDAQLFHFLLHFALQQPYPYDKPSGILRLPPARLLSSRDAARYVQTLDALATPHAQFRDQLPEYFAASRVFARIEGDAPPTQ